MCDRRPGTPCASRPPGPVIHRMRDKLGNMHQDTDFNRLVGYVRDRNALYETAAAALRLHGTCGLDIEIKRA